MKKTRRSYNSTLPAGKPLKRKTRLKIKGRSRFPKRRSPKYCAWIRSHPCLLAERIPGWIDGDIGCGGRVECAHVISRGAGGHDVANTVPLCTRHHRQSHRIGQRTFEKMYDVSLELKALVFGARQPPDLHLWREQQGETAA